MNRLIALLAALVIMVSPASTAPQRNRTITLVSGTAVRLVPNRTMANSLLIQVQPGSSNIVYVLWALSGDTCSNNTTSQIVATLAPGTSTAPGSSFTFPSNGSSTTQQGGTDVSQWCVQGTTGDTVIASWDQRN